MNTLTIEQMKDILSEAMEQNTNSNLEDCVTHDFDCNDLHNTIIGNYPLIGFECYIFKDMSTAISSGCFNTVLIGELEEYSDYDNDSLDGLDDFIDSWIEVTTEYKTNTIKAFVSAVNGKHEVYSDILENETVESFKSKCEQAVNSL